LAIADRAYQRALAFARERRQSREVAGTSRAAAPIIKHPDVRRMLMSMKSQLEAMRALAYVTGGSLDLALKHPDPAVRKRHKAFVELMVPVVKGWCAETAIELCSTALQVFGGMGYIEETGVAQQYRDVRIVSIYEGTTGIQALDLVGRKLIRDMGTTASAVIEQMQQFAATLDARDGDLAVIKRQLATGSDLLAEASNYIGMHAMSDLNRAFSCSVPYLRLWGVVAGGWQMARAAQISARRIAAGETDPFYAAKLATARFYADHVLSQAVWLHHEIVHGSASVMTVSEEQFGLDRALLVPA
jgi:hypothetical protein